MSQLKDRDPLELGVGVADQLAKCLVGRGQAPVEVCESHARLRLRKQSAEAGLTLSLCRLRAVPVGHIPHDRKQPARPFGGQRPDRRLDLAALAFLGDERGLIVHRHLPTAEAGRQLLGQDLALLGGRQIDE